MRVEFRKVSSTLTPFSLKKDGVEFSGDFKKLSSHMIQINLKADGKLLLECDGCLENFELMVNETSKLLVSDGVYDGDDMDVIESFDSFLDFDKVARSELESIRSDYHYCKNCKNNFKE